MTIGESGVRVTPSATTAVVVCDEQRSALTLLVDIDVDKVVHQALAMRTSIIPVDARDPPNSPVTTSASLESGETSPLSAPAPAPSGTMILVSRRDPTAVIVETVTVSARRSGGECCIEPDIAVECPTTWTARFWPTLVAAGLLMWSLCHRSDIGAAFAVLALTFTVIERVRPLQPGRDAFRRIGAGTDMVSFAANEILAGLGTAGIVLIATPTLGHLLPTTIRERMVTQPGWTRWLEALIVAEVAGYWGHRLSHEIPLLWKFHRVHHTATNLDWLATNRRHPIDAMIDRLSTALPMIALGFPVPTILAVFVAKRFRGSFVHSNTNIRFGVLERIYVTPFFHHWHHSNEPDTRNTNYALSFPAIDWLFGTLHLPDRWPDDYGCDGTTPDTGYLNRLLNPWSTPTPTRRAPEARSADVVMDTATTTTPS